jgi:hypothetical protein
MSEANPTKGKSLLLVGMSWFNGVVFAAAIVIVHLLIAGPLLSRFGSEAAETARMTGFGWAVAALGAGTIAGARVWQEAIDDRSLLRSLRRLWLWESATVLAVAVVSVWVAARIGGRP